MIKMMEKKWNTWNICKKYIKNRWIAMAREMVYLKHVQEMKRYAKTTKHMTHIVDIIILEREHQQKAVHLRICSLHGLCVHERFYSGHVCLAPQFWEIYSILYNYDDLMTTKYWSRDFTITW